MCIQIARFSTILCIYTFMKNKVYKWAKKKKHQPKWEKYGFLDASVAHCLVIEGRFQWIFKASHVHAISITKSSNNCWVQSSFLFAIIYFESTLAKKWQQKTHDRRTKRSPNSRQTECTNLLKRKWIYRWTFASNTHTLSTMIIFCCTLGICIRLY